MLLIVAFTLSIAPSVIETGYTPLPKLEALNYAAIMNASRRSAARTPRTSCPGS